MNTNKIAVFFLTALLSLSACKDDLMKEVTTLNVSRAFSPTDLEVRVVNKTGVRLNWTPVKNANTYTIELFENGDLDFSGTPVKTVDSVTEDQLPYVISGLDGATPYSVRVKASGEGVDDSKYVSAAFTTEAEQIFQKINLEKMETTSAALNWPAGEEATSIVLTPGNITHEVTAEEIAAGEAVVSGLTAGTTYTATLLRGTKTRGTITFTTLWDPETGIAVHEGDNLADMIANAADGAVFAVYPGTYNVNNDVTVSKSVTIRGVRPLSGRPVINGLVLKINANAGLTLRDLVLDGASSASGNQTIVYNEDLDNPYGDFTMQDCEVKNYLKGIYYVNKKALINSVTFTGNVIHDIECSGGDFIDFRKGLARTFLFENNTVYNSASSSSGARDLFRMDAGGSDNFDTETSIITVRTNTFYNASNSSSKRFFYIRLEKHEIHVIKNIMANTDAMYTDRAETTITEVSGNNYFNAPDFTSSEKATYNDTGNHTTLDPGFADPASGNFTISNEDLKFGGIGDPRWR